MPPLLPEIILFWACVHAALWLLRRMPNSRAAKIAFALQGPYPFEGERKSAYYLRKAFFALGWFAQILTAALVVLLIAWSLPQSDGAETFVLVATFALTIGGGMAVLGALLAGLVSVKSLTIGPNPEFEAEVVTEPNDSEGP